MRGRKNSLGKGWLRSWVQIIPPGPFFPVVQLRYYFRFIVGGCRTNWLPLDMIVSSFCVYVYTI